MPTSEPLLALVDRVREVTGRRLPDEITAVLVAECLRPILMEPLLLTQQQRSGDVDAYQQHVLHVEPGGGFSVVALVWEPGQTTVIHDHVAWCASGIYQGQETEEQYRVLHESSGRPGHLAVIEHLVNSLGSVSGIAPPGDIHRVHNSGTGTTISIHVYGADFTRLGSSIRRTYDLPVLGLV